MNKHYYYHLTMKKNISSILKKGLLPKIGDHCKQVGDESTPRVFLCSKYDISSWAYQICADALIRIEDAGVIEEVGCWACYTAYDEFIYPMPIKAKYLSEQPLPEIPYEVKHRAWVSATQALLEIHRDLIDMSPLIDKQAMLDFDCVLDFLSRHDVSEIDLDKVFSEVGLKDFIDLYKAYAEVNSNTVADRLSLLSQVYGQ